MMDKKPKCYLCGEVGDDTYYLWVEQRGRGYLAHDKCYVRIAGEVRRNTLEAIAATKKAWEEAQKTS